MCNENFFQTSDCIKTKNKSFIKTENETVYLIKEGRLPIYGCFLAENISFLITKTKIEN